MNIAGRLVVLIGVCLPIMCASTSSLANEEICDFQGLVTVKKFATAKKIDRLPKNAVMKVQLIEAALFDVNAPVIAGGDLDVSGQNFPLGFNMNLDCEKLKRSIMPSFNIRVELEDELLFINDSMHPFSHDVALQRIELKKIY